MKLLHLLFLLFVGSVSAGEFPEVYNSEADQSATPPTAAEAVEMFDLPEGFTAQVYAAEPEVRNPIAMAWDHRGRIWVAENYTYAERAMRFDLSLKDRVLIFEDTDWDGVADSRKVFTEDVQMLTSVEVGRGGVWLMCPPQLLFIPDRDGDDVPDAAPEVVLDGFTVAQSNYHNFANGLRWGPDGWLYGRCGHSCPGNVGVPGTPDEERIPIEGGIWRFHPERKTFEVLTHGTTNPWGHDWDRHGELFFINTVNGHLWHGIAGAHFTESFGADPNPWAYERIDTHADHYHYDRTGSWTKSRDGAANEFGGGHAHIGMMIYQGESWPERFHDRLFTINMHGRRTNVERLERVGTGFVGRHEPDIFLMGDEWYRGIDIRPGPDGSVYMIDWSDTGECHEHTGVHRTSGRIYRISYGETDKPTFPEAGYKWTFHENPWYSQSAWRGEETLEQSVLFGTLQGEGAVENRLRAMWALHRSGKSPVFWKNFFDDGHESIRAWAVRLLLDQEPIDTILGPLESNLPKAQPDGVLNYMIRLAREDDSGLVRLALASGLQRLPLSQRVDLGKVLAAREEDAEDHNQPMMVWFGVSPLAESDPAALIEIAEATEWPDLLRWISRSLSSQIEEHPQHVDSLLSHAGETELEKKAAIIAGVNEGLQGWRKAPKPSSWDKFVAATAKSEDESFSRTVQELSLLFGDGRALDEIKTVALDPGADHAMRKAALETLIEARPDDLREICEKLLGDKMINSVAVKGLVLFDDEELGRSIAKQYRRFYPLERPSVMESLVSRPEWAQAMLDEMKQSRIPKTDLSAFQARQISAFGKEELTSLLIEVWGEARTSSEDKRELIASWTGKLHEGALVSADLGKGRQLYAAVCSSCHLLYGEGGKVGPDLTGSGRSELEYLLENILDPSAVVGADYQMSILTMKDRRLLTGVVAAENEKTLTLRQLTGEITVEKSEIEKRELSPVSMMPEGLLQAFEPDQVRDLIAYLKHPVQVALPD
ncbi:MAG: PVC-type heme-binding CxxCH protein [Verrucomicrobiota bacterium]